MNWISLLVVTLLFGCNQPSEQLSLDEIEQIKSDIIERSEQHGKDLKNMDYEAVMTFYAKDHIFFGDGYYWGDYHTVAGIWKDLLGEGGWQEILYWKLQNHKIHVFSREAASYLVEFDHEHIQNNGDKAISSGNFSYGMQKIDGEWKAVTAHISHTPIRTKDDKWWEKYSPSKRN